MAIRMPQGPARRWLEQKSPHALRERGAKIEDPTQTLDPVVLGSNRWKTGGRLTLPYYQCYIGAIAKKIRPTDCGSESGGAFGKWRPTSLRSKHNSGRT